ncbi:ribonucleotide-diphosphate reductase subunit beta (plasmid) [Leifsonia sp. ZF2019]|nr:ribonucleotide-diphosphate reductase subunit beta [Leifsonia sp. ZF2019]UAJ81781.1 ribonucleotide-diphosphate reductase subunit beta [Leifsonia sp. ZF2019]
MNTNTDINDQAQEIGGYVVPSDPMDGLQCESCQ